MAGVSQPAVSKALRARRLIREDDGGIDPDHPTNAAWLARHRHQALPDPVGGKLRNLEYDVMLHREFYTERAPLAEWLHKIANAVVTGVRSVRAELLLAD
jgi:hypothetical protein